MPQKGKKVVPAWRNKSTTKQKENGGHLKDFPLFKKTWATSSKLVSGFSRFKRRSRSMGPDLSSVVGVLHGLRRLFYICGICRMVLE